MIYETYADLAKRVRSWSKVLPEFVAVGGIGRSGSLVASIFAAERNIHLIDPDELGAYRPWKAPLRRECPAKEDGLVLLVDDTVSSGGTMAAARMAYGRFPFVRFGAVYVQTKAIPQVDFYAVDVGETDHVFEWNVFHHWFTEQMCFDMDGILCDDWHLGPEQFHQDVYLDFVTTVRRLIRPSFPIGEIVTGRLEQYRPQTVEWLAENGIRYHRLTMNPFPSAECRDQYGAANWKAEVFAARSGMRAFIESCPTQAKIIAETTNLPVLSWPENKFYNGVAI